MQCVALLCRLCFTLFFCWFGYVAAAAPAAAETDNEAVLKQKMRVMEARLDYLENRLKQFEKAEAEKMQKNASAQKGKSAKNSTAAASAPTKTEETVAASTPTKTEETAAVGTSTKTEDPAAQEYFLFRDLSPTLKKGQWEFSQEMDYIRENGFLTQDRIGLGISSIRYGLTDRLELGLSLPYYYSERLVQTFGGQNKGVTQSFGDMVATASYALKLQNATEPGFSVTASYIHPLGKSPYNWISNAPGNANQPYQTGTNPIDPLISVQSRDQDGVRGTVVGYKIFDPIMVFASVGADYYFPKTFLGAYTLEGGYPGGMRYLGNAGVSFALSEKATIGMAVTGIYSPNLWINGVKILQSYEEQYTARIVATLQVADNWFLEPAVAFGLTSDSPSMALSLALRLRSDPPKEEKGKN